MTARYRILGPIELYDGETRIPGGGPRQVALLAFLLVHANRAVSTDQLLEALWRDEPRPGAAKRVHVAVARLRKLLAANGAGNPLHTLVGGYRLATEPGEVDAYVFAAQLESARRVASGGDHASAVRILDKTLPLWRGPPLADVGYEDFAQAEIRRLEELRLAAIEARADSCLAMGRHGPLVSELGRVVADHPTHERLAGQLMVALYRSGRQADALETYQRTYRHLVSSLGLEPGPALKRLQHEILEQAAGLGAPADATPGTPRADAKVVSDRPERAPLPALLQSMAQHAFVGRSAERSQLERCWDAASASQRSVAVVAGEPGIGKTAIAAQLAKHVQLRGGSVLYGACEPQSVVPYHPVVMALREHFRHVRPPWRTGEWLGDVAAVLGLTSDLCRSPPRSESADDERYWLFEGVRRMLELLAGRQPLLLVADDLHWAEPSTLMMIGHLAREGDPAPLMLLATYRDTEVTADHPPHEDWRSTRVRPVDDITLSGLQEKETAELIEARVGGPVAKHIVDRWHERTGGHPFFLQQLVRRAHADTIGYVPAADLPAGVRELISRRVRRLAEEPQVTLRAAAVIGREFDLPLVSTLAGNSIDSCLAALEEAIACGLVYELPDLPDRFVFAHALVQEVLYEQQARSRRIRLHARVANVLEQLGASAVTLAHHFFEARYVTGYTKAIEHSRAAAREADAALAYEDAAAHYRRALAALDAAPTDDEAERCALLLALGEAEARAGLPTVDATFAEAVQFARRRADADQLARAALAGRQTEPAFRDDARIALLKEALAALGDERSSLRVEVLAHLASVLHFGDTDEEARAVSAEALELADDIGDPHALIAALHGRHAALMHIAHVEERLYLLARLIDVAERNGAFDFVAMGYEWSVYGRLEVGELQDARRELERFAAVAAELRQPRFDHAVLAWRAVFAQLDGRLDEAERLAQEGYRYAGRVQIADAEALLASQMCFIRRDQDRLTELLPAIGSYASTAGDFSWRAGLIVALAAAGELERARSAFEAAGQHAFEDVPRDYWWLSTLSLFAEGCALVGEERHAAALYGLLEPYAERHAQLVFVAHLGSVHRFLGLLAAVSGDFGRSIEHLEAAWERHEATGSAALGYRSACDLAGILVRTGGDRDRGRAEDILRTATAESRVTPLGPLVARLAGEARRTHQDHVVGAAAPR